MKRPIEDLADELYSTLQHLYGLQQIKTKYINNIKKLLKTNYRQLKLERHKSHPTINRYLINLETRGKIRRDLDHIKEDGKLRTNQLFIEII